MTILAVNEIGYDSGYGATGALGALAVLQDVGEVKVWESWDVTYRDVFVVNGCGETTAVFNLSANNLENEANYNQLKALILEAVEAEP